MPLKQASLPFGMFLSEMQKTSATKFANPSYFLTENYDLLWRIININRFI